MSSDDLANFLEENRTGKHDSVGEFTIDGKRAQEKLGQSQLHEPGLWVVKLVQAAVNLGCSSISIALNVHETVVTFHGNPAIDVQELAQLMLDGQLPTTRWKRHLVVGLRSLYARRTHALTWSDSSELQVVLDGDGLRMESKATATEGVCFQLVAKRFRSSLFTDLLGRVTQRFLAEHEALTSRCGLCPVPLYLNGENIAGVLPPPDPPEHNSTILLTRAAKFTTLVVQQRKGGFPLWVHSKPLNISTFSRVPRVNSRPYQVNAVSCLSLSNASYCIPVQDGATLDSIPMTFDPQGFMSRYGLYLYVDGNDAEVDLTEFAVRKLQFDLKSFKSHLRKSISRAEFPREVGNRPIFGTSEQDIESDRKLIHEAIKKLEIPLLDDP